MNVDFQKPVAQSPLPPTGSAAKLHHAAEQFEAMFVGQMLKSARESASEEADDDDSGTNSPFMEMAEDQLAQVMAARGGLGIATIVMKDLATSK